MPDERCRVLRRRLARREQLVRSRSRVKNEVHAVLMRRLQGKPPCSDLFGVKGLKWLGSRQLPVEEAETVQAGLREIAFLDHEIEAVERLVAKQMLNWPEATVVNQPGPLRAYYQRIRAGRGHGKAIVAAARKLAVLFWCMLSRGQDYAHQQQSLTAQKLRRLEITAGALVRKGKPSGVWVTYQKMRQAEKQLAASQGQVARQARELQTPVTVRVAVVRAVTSDPTGRSFGLAAG